MLAVAHAGGAVLVESLCAAWCAPLCCAPTKNNNNDIAAYQFSMKLRHTKATRCIPSPQ